MQEVRVCGKECGCDPTNPGTWKKPLVLNDKVITMLVCPHIDVFTYQPIMEWKKFGPN